MVQSPILKVDDNPVVSSKRVKNLLDSFSLIGTSEKGSVSRIAFSPEDIKARNFFIDLLTKIGLKIKIDSAGNIIGRLDGKYNNLSPIVTGSHLDTVPKGGKFDGTLGVIAGIEVAFLLNQNKIKLNRPFEIIVFADEESTMIGSKALAGNISKDPKDYSSSNSKSIISNLNLIGGNWEKIHESKRSKDDIFAFIELHVEQGEFLENGNFDIGIVNGIVGQKRISIKVKGQSNHAGTTSMLQRSDALIFASKIILGIEQITLEASDSAVATVGKLNVFPNAPNVIPGEVVFSVDIRDIDINVIDHILEQIKLLSSNLGNLSTCAVEIENEFEVLPTKSCPQIVSNAFYESENLGYKTSILPSKASHDSQEIVRITPMTMIFVPSRNGLSHSFKEFTSLEECTNVIQVLLNTIFTIDRKYLPKEAGIR